MELVLLERHVAVAQLAFHGRGERAGVLHHHVFGLGVANGTGEVQRQLGPNLVAVHRARAGHAIEGLDIFLLK